MENWTEQGWLACDNPRELLLALRSPLREALSPNMRRLGCDAESIVSDRKLRLFSCACVRHGDMDQETEEDVSDAEKYADGQLEEFPSSETVCNEQHADLAALWAVDICRDMSRSSKVAVLRDIIGNPFRPAVTSYQLGVMVANGNPPEHGRYVYYDMAWSNPTVLSLARVAYAHRDRAGVLDRETLLALSDALEEAGCEEDTGGSLATPSVLLHLRNDDKHWRGCWAMDLVLGKD